MQADEVGSFHELLLRCAQDTSWGFKRMPGGIIYMLKDDRWRNFVLRGNKVVRHSQLDTWLFMEPRDGLGLPSWEVLYTVLARTEEGHTAIKMLVEKGAPPPAIAAAVDAVKDARPVGKPGGDRRSEKARDQGSDRTLKRGENAAYLAARLKRDAPEIAAAVERGEYKSMRAAAKAAGIIKIKTPAERAIATWGSWSEDLREAVMEHYGL